MVASLQGFQASSKGETTIPSCMGLGGSLSEESKGPGDPQDAIDVCVATFLGDDIRGVDEDMSVSDAFEVMDKNKDGVIDREEFKAAPSNMHDAFMSAYLGKASVSSVAERGLEDSQATFGTDMMTSPSGTLHLFSSSAGLQLGEQPAAAGREHS